MIFGHSKSLYSLFSPESRYPDEEAGEIPMAYIVRRPGSTITESQIIDIIAKQVNLQVNITKTILLDHCISVCRRNA